MGKAQFTEAISAMITPSSESRFVSSQYAGVKVNSLMFDVVMTPASSKSWDLSDLAGIYCNINFRRKNSDTVQLADNVSLYDFFAYSDYNAGVSISLVNVVAPKTSPVEVSAVIPFGLFDVGIDESLEFLLTGKPAGIANYDSIRIGAKWVYVADTGARTYGYKSFKSSGGEQGYRDVLNVFYIGAAEETNATIRDYTGSQSINLRDAVAFANAAGRFEYFSDFGHLYSDPTQLSQDITISLPQEKKLLLQQEFFSLLKSSESDQQTLMDTQAVLNNIYAARPEKFQVLRARGLVPSGFSPVAV
jgi:hypothetical protein